MKGYITLDGFETMSEQQIFDVAVKHIAETRVPSLRKGLGAANVCSYMGTGCNAAPLIKPEMRELAENCGSWQDVVGHELAPLKHERFMMALQDAHDRAARVLDLENPNFLAHWKKNMRKLANKNGLCTEELEKVKV